MLRRGIIGVGVGGSSILAYVMTNTPEPSVWDLERAPKIGPVTSMAEIHDRIFEFGDYTGIWNGHRPTSLDSMIDGHRMLPNRSFDLEGSASRYELLLTASMLSRDDWYRQTRWRQTFGPKSAYYGQTLVSVVGGVGVTAIAWLGWMSPKLMLPLLAVEYGEKFWYHGERRDRLNTQLSEIEQRIDHELLRRSAIEATGHLDCYACLEEAKPSVSHLYSQPLEEHLDELIADRRRHRCLCRRHDEWWRRIFELKHLFFLK